MQLRQVKDIQYHLLPGVARKTTDIVIERDGLITVRPPKRMSAEEVDETVLAKRMWIYRNLAEWEDLNATRVVREWVNGESFLYLGSQYRLSLVENQEEDLKLKEGRFCLRRELLMHGGAAAAQKAFETFYSNKGEERLAARVRFYEPKVGIRAGSVTVKELGFRWAACMQSGDVHFHWRCLMAPLTVIDYIVVHELCHLRHRDHSDAFWNEVDKILPDYKQRKEWLRLHGVRLDL
jgi:predicted metal-dependent hydrolase